jgi:hypothetical protein
MQIELFQPSDCPVNRALDLLSAPVEHVTKPLLSREAVDLARRIICAGSERHARRLGLDRDPACKELRRAEIIIGRHSLAINAERLVALAEETDRRIRAAVC